MKVSIIGGAGFIGTALCRLLKRAQISFEILDLATSQSFSEKSKRVDVRDGDALEKALAGDIVVNLAAIHRDDVTDLQEYYSTNVKGARVLSALCARKGIKKIIFTSSVAVYGFAAPATAEEGRVNPVNEYGRTKALAEEEFAKWYQKDTENRSLLIIRPTVVFGEGNRGNVYNLLNQINSGLFMMIGTGENKKSMAYVENVAAFLLHCIQTSTPHGVYNYIDKPDSTMNELVCLVRAKLKGKASVGLRLPYGAGLFIGYLADFVAYILGVKLPISSIRVKKFCASSEFSTAKSELDGFKASYTLQEGLARTLQSEFILPDADRQIFYTE